MTDKTLTLDFLKQLRAAGVKNASFGGDGELEHVEFFPRSILDVSGLDGEAADPDGTETERPPPAEHEPNIAPAFARILGKQSVS